MLRVSAMGHAESFDTRDPFRPSPLLAALSLLLIWCAAQLRAEEPSRTEPARMEAAAAATAQEPERRSFVKRKLDSLLGIDDDRQQGQDPEGGLHWGPFYPSVGVVSTGSSVGPMVELWQRDLFDSSLDLHGAAAWSVRQYQYYAVRFGRLPRRDFGPPSLATGSDRFFPLTDIERLSGTENRWAAYTAFRYRDYPEEDFYGVGDASRAEDRADYRLRDRLVEVVTSYHFTPRVAVAGRVGLLQPEIGTGRDDSYPDLAAVFDDRTAPGLATVPDQWVSALGLLADLRDEPGNPHRGALFTLGVSRFDARGGAPFDFTRAAGDARVYLPLGTRRHVVAARSVLSVDRPDDGHRVPFFLQSALGGSRILRGHPSFRFRDEVLLALSAEYRFEVVKQVELALFYDAGQAVPGLDALSFSDLRTAWGGGIRLKSPRKVRLRFDVAKSREDVRYLVKLGPSF